MNKKGFAVSIVDIGFHSWRALTTPLRMVRSPDFALSTRKFSRAAPRKRVVRDLDTEVAVGGLQNLPRCRTVKRSNQSESEEMNLLQLS